MRAQYQSDVQAKMDRQKVELDDVLFKFDNCITEFNGVKGNLYILLYAILYTILFIGTISMVKEQFKKMDTDFKHEFRLTNNEISK